MQKRKPWLQPGNSLSFFHFLPSSILFSIFIFAFGIVEKKKKNIHRSHGKRYNRGTNFFPPVLCESLPLFSGLISRATRLFSTARYSSWSKKNAEARMFLYGYFYMIESAYINVRAYYVRIYLPSKINYEILFWIELIEN